MSKKKWIALICACLMIVSVLAGCSGNSDEGKKDEKYVAVVNGVRITRPIFAAMFNLELSKLFTADEECLPFEDIGRETFYKALKERKNEDGKTYYEQLVESTLESSRQFVVNMQMAQGDKDWPSDEDMKKSKDELKSDIEMSAIQYQIESADEFCIMMELVPLQDYLEFAILSEAIDAYNQKKMDAFKVDADDLFAFYEAHFDAYEDLRVRTVKVRHSLFMTEGLSSDEKTALKAKVDGYIEAYKNGTMTMDEIVALTGDVGSDGKPNADGYYDVTEGSNFVPEFLDWAMARETVSAEKELDVVESDYGYHIMQCTKIWTLSYEDDAVKDVVELDFRIDLLDKEVQDLAKDAKYDMKDRKDDVIESFVRQIATLSFEGSKPIVLPEKVEDAPAGEAIVGMLGEDKMWLSDYSYFFSSAVREVVGTDFKVDQSLSEKEQVEQLNAFLNSPYKDTGKTYLQYCKERALQLQKEIMIVYNKAIAENGELSKDRIKEINSEVDSMIEQYLSYNGSSMGITTKDEMMQYMMSMNVNEYKRLNLMQTIVSEYSTKKTADMKPEATVLKDFYNAHKDLYRVVTVRHIYLAYADKNGNLYDDEKKAEVTALANQLVQKLRNGDDAELLVQTWSQDTEAEYDLGLVDLLAGSTALDKAVVDWALAQNTIGATTVKLIATESGYEIVIVEGILEYDGQKGITANSQNTLDSLKTSIETSYKNEQFQKMVDGFVAEADLTVTDVDEEAMQKVAEAYLDYEPEEDKKEE